MDISKQRRSKNVEDLRKDPLTELLKSLTEPEPGRFELPPDFKSPLARDAGIEKFDPLDKERLRKKLEEND